MVDRVERGGAGKLWPALVVWLVVPAVIAVLMAYYLAVSRRVVGEFGFPLDDSWIHVRFAQNLARGEGFSFNPGEPASTTTAPLWTLLLAFGYRVTGEYFFTAAALNWAICCLCAATVSALAQTLVPRRSFGAAAAIVFAVTIPLPWFALSGMEPPLFMWLSVLGIVLHVRLRKAGGVKSLASAVAFALASLARPECLVLFPLAMLDRLLMVKHDGEWKPGLLRWVKQLAIHTAVFGVLVAPMFVYNYRVIGRLLPSSFYVKAMNYGITWALAVGNSEFLQHCLFVAPLQEALALLKLWGGNNIVLLAPFLLGLLWITWRAWAGREERCPSLMLSLALVVQPIAWAIATNFHRTEGPAFQSQRYVANVGPLYIIVGLAGAWWLVQQLAADRRRLVWVAVVTLAVAASLVRHRDEVGLYTTNVKNITELQVVTARWIRDNLPRDALLAVNDVGAIAVITECRIYDMIGLVSRESLACLSLEHALTGAWRDCRREAFVAMEPDYFVTNATRDSFHNYAQNPYLDALIYDTEIDDNITAGGSMMVVFRTVWCKDPPVAGSDESGSVPHADARR